MSRVLRNRVGAAALVGVLALAVTACSGTGEADAPQSGSDAPSTSTEAPPESSVEVPEGRVVPVENSSGDAVKIAMIGFSNNPYWVGVSEGTTYANDVLASYDGSVDWIVAGTRQDVQTINSAILAAANQGYDGIGFFIGGEDRAVDGLHVLPGPGDDPVHGTVVAGEDVVGVGGALRDPDPVGVVGEADHGDLDGVATAVLHRNDAPLRHLDARLRRRLRAGARRVRSGLRGIRLPVPEQAVTASASTPTRAAAPTRFLSTLLISSSSSHRHWCVDAPAVYAICRRARPRKAGGGRESARREPLMPSLCIAGQKLHAAREPLGLAAALRPYSTCKDRMSRSEDPCERSPDRPGRRERSHSRVAAGRRADRPRDVDASAGPRRPIPRRSCRSPAPSAS